VDGENLMYRGETASPHNVERFTSFSQGRAEYPGHDTCVSVVYKRTPGGASLTHVRMPRRRCVFATWTGCAVGRVTKVDDVALLVCAICRRAVTGRGHRVFQRSLQVDDFVCHGI
jgi:hypothetical protein